MCQDATSYRRTGIQGVRLRGCVQRETAEVLSSVDKGSAAASELSPDSYNLMPTQAPWDLYAKQLWPLRYGHPLWIPEPSITGRQTLIGDVGWLKTGGFRPLFHSMKPANDPLNVEKGVPEGFKPFNPPFNSLDQRYDIHQMKLASQGIYNVEASADIQGGLP